MVEATQRHARNWACFQSDDICGDGFAGSVSEEWYETLIAMTKTADALIEGYGNLGSPDGDPPAAPAYTACGLTKKGREVAEALFAKNPGLQAQPKEFFRGV